MIIAVNIRTGEKETMTDDQGARLRDGNYGHLFNFIEVIEPPEVKEVEESPKPKKVNSSL